MTAATAPQPVEAGAKSEGPNKVLLIALALVAAVALFMYVVKPMLFDSDDAGVGVESVAPADDSSAGSGSGAAVEPEAAAPDSGTPPAETEEVPAEAAPPAVNDPTVSDSTPVVDPQYASTARDPFAPLPGEEASSSTEVG